LIDETESQRLDCGEVVNASMIPHGAYLEVSRLDVNHGFELQNEDILQTVATDLPLYASN